MKTLSDIKAAAEKHGSHWFDRDTMAFFNTRLQSKAYPMDNGDILFVTSERVDADHPRRYSIRRAYFDGEGRFQIRTIGDFQEYATADKAHRAAELLARTKEGMAG